jgi:hypothetical protein
MRPTLSYAVLLALGLAPVRDCGLGPCLKMDDTGETDDPEDSDPPDTYPWDTGPHDTGPHDTAPPDADDDGWSAGEDCDDGDPEIHPGAEEVCDGVDNDCDGEVDEGLGTSWYEDFDGDGYGAPGTGVVVCDACLTGYVRDQSDCDDGDAAIHPAADERCDGLDNDCDGDVDEGCVASNRAATRRDLAARGVLPRDVAERLG